jgi:hypothetical protein
METKRKEAKMVGHVGNRSTVTDLVSGFSDCNLSLWAKENDKLEFSSRARFINAVLSGINFAVKSQANYIHGVQDKIKDALASSNSTDTHEAYLQGLMDNVTQDDITTFEFEPVIQAFKEEYKSCTGDEWKPYVAKDKNQLGKNLVTASRLEAMEMLKSKGVVFDIPDAMKEVIA